MFTAYAGDPRVMPIRAGMPPPSCLRHDGTSWILRSETGAVLVMDCGSQEVIDTLRQQLESGEITAVEGLWITHYHHDHVDAAPAFQQAFDCPTIADETLAAVIAHPLDWRLPCNSPFVVPVDHVTRAGERWQWHEFTLTAYPFPGQTLYHDGLLVEGAGLRMFFAGDSFTPAGIDDYCAQNRNFLGAGVGFDQCLALMEELQPAMIFNEHVDVAFDFTPEEIRFMRENLMRRESLFGALFPWEHANFGLDEWVRCLPYEQNGYPGAMLTILVSITNHAAEARQVTCELVPPPCWPSTPANSATIAAKSTVNVPLTIDVPLTAVPGRYVLPVDIIFGERRLPQFTEAIVVI
jgi:glyoxylase-like metal-dependent hydrolase (beta-lactamase superfamily II)